MKRRNFLRSAASAFPIALTQSFALATESFAEPTSEVHVVPSGQDCAGEAHSRGYSHILFKNTTQQTSGNLFLIEHKNLVAGGPPLHMHLDQEEWFFVIEGGILFQIGDKRLHLKAGDSVLAPRKVPHAFCIEGSTPGRMLIGFTPAGKMEQFFRDTAIPNPPVEDAAFFRRYDMQLVGPPIKPA